MANNKKYFAFLNLILSISKPGNTLKYDTRKTAK